MTKSARYWVTGAAVYASAHGVEVELTSDVGHTVFISPTQVTGVLRDVACLSHDAAVGALLKALRDDRDSGERTVGRLWLALAEAVDGFRRERLSLPVVPAVSTAQARRAHSVSGGD